MKTLMSAKKSRGIWDLYSGPPYSDYNAGLLQICDRDGNDERSVAFYTLRLIAVCLPNCKHGGKLLERFM